MYDRLRIGVLTSPHGVRGESRVYPTTDDLKRFGQVKEVILVADKKEINTRIVSYKLSKNMVICKFEGIDTLEEIDKLRNYDIYVEKSSLPKLAPNENYISDLIDLSVITNEGQKLGKVSDVFPTGANHVLEVEKENGKKLLFPYIKQCILEVNLAEKYIKVELMDGILDLEV